MPACFLDKKTLPTLQAQGASAKEEAWRFMSGSCGVSATTWRGSWASLGLSFPFCQTG